MWPFRKHPYPRPGPIRYMELLSELTACADREDNASHLLRMGLITTTMFYRSVFEAREREIEVLRELRWTRAADTKQADLDMRKGWAAEPFTPLVDPLAKHEAWIERLRGRP